MHTFTTYQDAAASLTELIASQDGTYDADAIAEAVIESGPDEHGTHHYWITEDPATLWAAVQAAAIED